MGKSAYIKLVDASTVQQLTLDDVKEKLNHFISMSSKTGQQLDWNYADAAFPYTIVQKPEAEGQWFYLKGKDQKLYKYIVVGVGTENVQVGEEVKKRYFCQIVLPEGSLHGDKSKANEYCKFLAKEWKAELHLFNGRVMYYYPRK